MVSHGEHSKRREAIAGGSRVGPVAAHYARPRPAPWLGSYRVPEDPRERIMNYESNRICLGKPHEQRTHLHGFNNSSERHATSVELINAVTGHMNTYRIVFRTHHHGSSPRILEPGAKVAAFPTVSFTQRQDSNVF